MMLSGMRGCKGPSEALDSWTAKRSRSIIEFTDVNLWLLPYAGQIQAIIHDTLQSYSLLQG
jgi:hypothetical protein